MSENIKKEKGIIRIILLYRAVSFVITSVIYFFSNPDGSMLLKTGITAGLVLAGIIVTYLHLGNRGNKRNIKILLLVEALGNGIILAVSGGFSSPYIWYFISTLLIAFLELSRENATLLSCIYFVIALITTWVTVRENYTAVELKLYCNIAMSYLLVAAGLGQMIRYAVSAEEKTKHLSLLNAELNETRSNIEKMLRFSMNIYETVNLFHSNDNRNVMDGLLEHFRSVVKTEECMLVLLSPFENAGQYAVSDMQEDIADRLAAQMQKNRASGWNAVPETVTESQKDYKVQFIQYADSVCGAFLYRGCSGAEDVIWNGNANGNELALFIKLAGIILTKMNFDEIGEKLIISEEQNRIANEIHDIVLQKLFAISCNLYILSTKCRDVENDSLGAMNQELLDIRSSIDAAMRELREAIYGMSWEKKGRDSFNSRIKEYMEEVSRMNGITINYEISGDTGWITANQKTALYRIMCEAVNNAIRHGRADKIGMQLSVEKTITNLALTDNGTGFDIEKYDQKENKGIGIRNINRIAALLRGTVDIKSGSEGGTSVTVRIPHSEGGAEVS